jgi:predicted ATPase/DNA-binding SARP family transcriptional activator
MVGCAMSAPGLPMVNASPPVALPPLRLCLLGGFQAWVGERAVPPTAWRLRKGMALVKRLALAPGQQATRDELLDALWPDLAPAAAANNLRQALHAARHALAPPDAAGMTYLAALDGGRLALQPASAVWIDVVAFEATATAARRRGEVAAYQAALALDGGELLPEDRYEDWTAARREALGDLARALRLELAALHERQGDLPAAMGVLSTVLAREPACEPAHQALLRLHARRGDVAAARRQYQALSAALANELDVAPDGTSQRLLAAIERGEVVEAPSGTPAQVAPALIPAPMPATGNLPAPLTALVGRTAELAALEDALATTRLLTLTGTGGVGKTRLALALAGQVAGEYPDGAWLVDLAPLAEPALVPQAVADALGLRLPPDQAPVAALARALRGQALLLVLDNGEHLAAAVADLVATLLAAAPGLRVLATSRVVLGVPGELVWRVPSLAPTEAAALFAARARLVRPDFQMTEQTAAVVEEICRRLDGMPLALELAAARLRVLSVTELAARLDDRFRLLVGGEVGTLPRHRTLRAALDWSYDLLTAEEQAAYAALGVFAGGWTLAAVAAVWAVDEGTALDLLGRLVDHSLVLAEPGEDDGTRYRLLETVRANAAERLAASDQAETVAWRHASYYLTLADAANVVLGAPRVETAVWLTRLAREQENGRAALNWALAQGERALAWRLVGAWSWVWWMRGQVHDGRQQVARALALGPLAAATPDLVRPWAAALEAAGLLAMIGGDLSAARTHYLACLAIWRDLGDLRKCGHLLNQLGSAASFAGDIERARLELEEGIALHRAAGDLHSVSQGQFQLGYTSIFVGDLVAAERLLRAGLAGAEANDLPLQGFSRIALGAVLVLTGRLDEATTQLAQGLDIFTTGAPDLWGLSFTLENIGGLAAARGQHEAALRLAGAVAVMRDLGGQRAPLPWGAVVEQLLAPARAALDPAAQAAAWAAGAALSVEAAVTEARWVLGDAAG